MALWYSGILFNIGNSSLLSNVNTEYDKTMFLIMRKLKYVVCLWLRTQRSANIKQNDYIIWDHNNNYQEYDSKEEIKKQLKLINTNFWVKINSGQVGIMVLLKSKLNNHIRERQDKIYIPQGKFKRMNKRSRPHFNIFSETTQIWVL